MAELRPNDIQTPVFGREIGGRLDVIQSADPFLVYLHGNIADATSWILDYDDLQSIQKNGGHNAFIQYINSFCRVLFFEISVDDVALSGKLMEWRREGFRPPSLFWLTNRTDDKIHSWANENYIRVIAYRASPNHDAVLEAFVNDCNSFHSVDAPVPPEIHSKTFSTNTDLSPSEAAALPPDDIRKFLNDKISKLLGGLDQEEQYQVFDEFLRKYSRAVHNSYFISNDGEDNVWFGNTLQFPPLGEGTFGQVYMTCNDSNHLAVKILREAIHSKSDMLGAFRRGVKSMKIIAKSNIAGMIRFRDAYEVPPTIIMDYVDGVSLEGAIQAGTKIGWLTKIRILKLTASIVRQAHLLPETVMHRDLKPSNIMLQHFEYNQDFNPDIVVLDFDMSWHKDSVEKDILFEARDDFAYLAPEQVSPSKLALSRSTLVDTYGLGMTAFFLFGASHPQINAYLDSKWFDQIYQAVRRGYNERWLSAPSRLSRLIQTCTSEQQSRRPDFSQIIAELAGIECAIVDFSILQDARLFAEELICHLVGTNRYVADPQGLRFYFAGPSGVTLESVCDIRRASIELSLSWLDQGTVERRSIRKYVEDAIEKSAAIIAGSAWTLNRKDPRQGGVSISASVYVSSAKACWLQVIQSSKDIYKQFDFA